MPVDPTLRLRNLALDINTWWEHCVKDKDLLRFLKLAQLIGLEEITLLVANESQRKGRFMPQDLSLVTPIYRPDQMKVERTETTIFQASTLPSLLREASEWQAVHDYFVQRLKDAIAKARADSDRMLSRNSNSSDPLWYATNL